MSSWSILESANDHENSRMNAHEIVAAFVEKLWNQRQLTLADDPESIAHDPCDGEIWLNNRNRRAIGQAGWG